MSSPFVLIDISERVLDMIWPRDVIFAERQEHDDQVEASCFDCGGDGGWEVITGYDPHDGEPLGYFETCPSCEGRGGGWIDAEPRTIEDLDP